MEICKDCGQEKGRFAELVRKKSIPFYCKTCGALKFRYQAIGDKVFLWPDLIEDKIGSIVIPDKWKSNNLTSFGTVLSVGKGCVDRGNRKFVPTEIKDGDYIVYDTGVPWAHDVLGADDRMYTVRIMGALDVKAKVE